MPDKFPITYQPRLQNVIAIEKQSGKEIEFDPNAEIKPWPERMMEEIMPTIPELFPEFKPLDFKIELPKDFAKRMEKRHRLLLKQPRKLKKAFKHLGYETYLSPVCTAKYYISCQAEVSLVPLKGYPYTKWIRKAIRIFKKLYFLPQLP